MRTLITIIVFVTVVATVNVVLWGGGDPCRARAELVAAQTGPVLDKLSAKYPLSIGVGRRLADQNRRLQTMIEEVVAEHVLARDEERDTNFATCVWDYYAIRFRQEQVQDEAVAEIEAALGLGGP